MRDTIISNADAAKRNADAVAHIDRQILALEDTLYNPQEDNSYIRVDRDYDNYAKKYGRDYSKEKITKLTDSYNTYLSNSKSNNGQVTDPRLIERDAARYALENTYKLGLPRVGTGSLLDSFNIFQYDNISLDDNITRPGNFDVFQANGRVFDSLPPDVQDLLKKAHYETSEERKSREIREAAGVTASTIPGVGGIGFLGRTAVKSTVGKAGAAKVENVPIGKVQDRISVLEKQKILSDVDKVELGGLKTRKILDDSTLQPLNLTRKKSGELTANSTKRLAKRVEELEAKAEKSPIEEVELSRLKSLLPPSPEVPQATVLNEVRPSTVAGARSGSELSY
jgi:hypothetical protein